MMMAAASKHKHKISAPSLRSTGEEHGNCAVGKLKSQAPMGHLLIYSLLPVSLTESQSAMSLQLGNISVCLFFCSNARHLITIYTWEIIISSAILQYLKKPHEAHRLNPCFPM